MTETRERSVNFRDLDHVKSMIERCLMLHMNKKQTVETLWKEGKIEPVFTETVWQRLRQENPDFFRAYYARLLLKDQIALFNMLLEMQANSMGIPRKSVCGRCGTAFLHRCGAIYVHCVKCSAIISGHPQEHDTGHASTFSAARCMPSNVNHLSAIKHSWSSGNPNIQVGAGDLFPTERMGIPGKIPDLATGHASTSLGAIRFGGSSENSDIPVGACDLFPAEGMGVPGKIPDHVTGYASTPSAAQYMPRKANFLCDIKHGVSLGHPNIHVAADATFPSGRSCISADTLETEKSRMQICHEATGTANKTDPSFLRNSGSDNHLEVHSTGDADGASSHHLEMSGKPSTELPLDDAHKSSKFSVPQDLAELLSDADESLFGSCPWTPESLTEFFHKDDTDLSGSSDQIPEHFSSSDLRSDAEHASTPSGADGLSSPVIPGGSTGHQRIQENGNACVPAHGLSISTSMLMTENLNTGTFSQVIDSTNMTDHGYLNNSGSTFSTDINHSGAAPDPPFQKLEMAEHPYDEQIFYNKTSSFELENQIPQILRFSDSTSAVQSSTMHHPSTPPIPDYVPDADNSLRSIIHGMPLGNQKFPVGTGKSIPTGPMDDSTRVEAKKDAETVNFQEAVNKIVPRSPSSPGILFPPGDNFSRKCSSTGHAPRPFSDNCLELTRQPFSKSPSSMDTIGNK